MDQDAQHSNHKVRLRLQPLIVYRAINCVIFKINDTKLHRQYSLFLLPILHYLTYKKRN